MEMQPSDFKKSRESLGLTSQGLARLFRMGKSYGQAIGKWEAGEIPIPGWASLIMEILISRQIPDLKQFKDKRRK